MRIGIVKLTPENLAKVCENNNMSYVPVDIQRSYFSFNSVAYCLLADGEPVFAGGIVNMLWQRGEAWMLPTPWFRSHVKTCYKAMREMVPEMAALGQFKRVQATCSTSISTLLFQHLGFVNEGVMSHFNIDGGDCHMYARIFT